MITDRSEDKTIMAKFFPQQHMHPMRRQAGFALIEAMVALLVVSFGLLSIASFQYTLSRSSDTAKQRTEATRIAQKEMDRLRSFGQRQSDGDLLDDRYTYVDDLVPTASPQTVAGLASNATYNLERAIVTPTVDRFRWINVIVWWNDRAGDRQEVRLASAISDGDPSALGVIGVQRRVSSTLRPRRGGSNIPFPTVNLAGGTNGAFTLPPGNTIFTFNNVTGAVAQRCTVASYTITALSSTGTTATALASGHTFATGTRVTIVGASPAGYNGDFEVASVVPGVSFTYSVASGLATPASLTQAAARISLVEGVDLATLSGVTCTAYETPGYLLSGYVRFKTSATATASNIDNPNDLTDPTQALRQTNLGASPPTQPLTITSSATGDAPSSYECHSQQQLIVRNAAQTELVIGEGSVVPPGYSDVDAPRFIAYACVVIPINHDNVAATAPIWSGELTLNPQAGSFGSNTLCRFTSDYNRNSALSNNEHPRYYRQVRGALENQNFLVVNGSCPSDVAADPASGNFLDTNTAQHQPSPELSFRCETVSCSSSDRVPMETTPVSPAAAIPME
jgi:type IV pilus modification protein PilV